MINHLLGDAYINKEDFPKLVWRKVSKIITKFDFMGMLHFIKNSIKNRSTITPFIVLIENKEILISNSDELIEILNSNIEKFKEGLLKLPWTPTRDQESILINRALKGFKEDPDLIKLMNFWISL